MDPYDSDSSGFEDEGDYTETGVLLGFASPEATDDTISHLGGWPVCQGHIQTTHHIVARFTDLLPLADVARRKDPASRRLC